MRSSPRRLLTSEGRSTPALPSFFLAGHSGEGTVCTSARFGCHPCERKEINMIRDQLTDAIEAATILQNGGKTVLSDAEPQMNIAAPNFAEGSLAEEAVEAGVTEHRDQ
jgi:hypothetical protein